MAARAAELDSRLGQARRAAAGAGTPAGGEELRAAWPGMTLEQRRATLERVLVCVMVKPATRRGRTTLDPDRVEPGWRA